MEERQQILDRLKEEAEFRVNAEIDQEQDEIQANAEAFYQMHRHDQHLQSERMAGGGGNQGASFDLEYVQSTIDGGQGYIQGPPLLTPSGNLYSSYVEINPQQRLQMQLEIEQRAMQQQQELQQQQTSL